MKVYEFTVSGNLYFPLDMLRSDSCWPATSEDVTRMHEASKPNAPIISVTLRSAHAPTVARWESFGWTVLSTRRF